MQKIRYRAIDMMRKRVQADKDVEIRDLASHLVSKTLIHDCDLQKKSLPVIRIRVSKFRKKILISML